MAFFSNLKYFLATALLLISSTSANLIIRNFESKILSSEFGYPADYTDRIDVIWSLPHSVQLEINEFQLDGQNGDFLIVSELPLLYEEYLNGTVLTGEIFNKVFMSSQALILSWTVNQTMQALSEHGTFVYFHAEPKPEQRDRQIQGFDIDLYDLDGLRTTQPPSTPEPEITTPQPGQEVYIFKFLSCNDPYEFVRNKNDFKSVIADLATRYCEAKGIQLDGPFNISEVNIPDNNGVHFCDPLWDIYNTCVEVRFAVVRYNAAGQYIMVRERLEEMWNTHAYQQILRQEGYCPYETPEPIIKVDSWIWIAGILGIITCFFVVFCFAWLRNIQENLRRRRQAEYAKSTPQPVEPSNSNSPSFIDKENPIVNFIRNFRKNSPDDIAYGEMTDGRKPPVNYSTNEFSAIERKPAAGYSTQATYENRAYTGDNGSDYEDDQEVETYEFKKGKLQTEPATIEVDVDVNFENFGTHVKSITKPKDTSTSYL